MSRTYQKGLLFTFIALLLLGAIWFVTSIPWSLILANTLYLVVSFVVLVVFIGVIVLIIRRLFRRQS
jgi:nitrate reductase gamma subunit